MLRLNNVRKVFNEGTVNEKVALQHVSLTVNDGDFVTIIGSNGAGKYGYCGQRPNRGTG